MSFSKSLSIVMLLSNPVSTSLNPQLSPFLTFDPSLSSSLPLCNLYSLFIFEMKLESRGSQKKIHGSFSSKYTQISIQNNSFLL